jgi:hypothetical protein
MWWTNQSQRPAAAPPGNRRPTPTHQHRHQGAKKARTSCARPTRAFVIKTIFLKKQLQFVIWKMAPERRHRLALGDPNPAAPFSCMNDATTSSGSRTRRYQHRSVGRRLRTTRRIGDRPTPPSAIPVQRHIHCPCPTLAAAAAAAGTAPPKT